jgi:hypothetical protein
VEKVAYYYVDCGEVACFSSRLQEEKKLEVNRGGCE